MRNLTVMLFVAMSWFVNTQSVYGQQALLSKTQALFAQVYNKLEPHQLLFITKPSLYELDSKKKLLTDTLSRCTILTYEEQEYQAPCRYFVLEDQVEIFTQYDRRILQANQVLALKMGEKVFVPKEYHYRSDIFYGYFEVLVEGKYSLYKKYTTSKKSDQIEEEYFYQKMQAPHPLPLSLKKKNIALCFEEEKENWRSYHRSIKPNWKHEVDLIQLFRHFNGAPIQN